MAIFEGRQLACIRGDRLVFHGLDFRFEAGDACLVTGPNGSGKSSLLRLMAGLISPASGDIFWRGGSATIEELGAEMHYLGHLDAVKPVLSVAENLAFWARLRGHTDIERGLDAFGLDALRDLPARVLSAGQKRRLALGRLLVAPATLWLLDEPTVALDRFAVAAIEAAIAEHRRSGGLAVVSSNVPIDLPSAHRLEISEFTSDDVADAVGDLH